MAEPNHTEVITVLEQVIEAQRAKLRGAHSVQKCLYEALLYAEGEEAVTFAEAAHVVASLVEEILDSLDVVHVRPLIEQVQREAIDSQV
jgi:hypothetical protein